MMGLSFIFGNSSRKNPKRHPKEIRTYVYQNFDTKIRDIRVSTFAGIYRDQRAVTITTTKQGLAQKIDDGRYRVVIQGVRTWPEELTNSPEIETIAVANEDGSQLFSLTEALERLKEIESDLAQEEAYVIAGQQPYRKKHFSRFIDENAAPIQKRTISDPYKPKHS